MKTWLRAGAMALALLASSVVADAQYFAGISPCAAATISVSNVSANTHLSTCGPSVLLWNITSQELFFNLGTASTTTATTSNYSIPGNSFLVINVGNAGASGLWLAAVTALSTTTLRITQGYAE